MLRRMYIITSILGLLVGVGYFCYGQAVIQMQHEVSADDGDKCSGQFTLNGIDLKDARLWGRVKMKPEDLLGYVECLAMLNSDISECDRLPSPQASWCRDNFKNHHSFYASLISLRNAEAAFTSGEIKKCMETTDFDRNQCMKYMEGFIRNDASICDAPPFNQDRKRCIAFIMLDDKNAGSAKARDLILYLKALRDFSVDSCQMISNSDWQRGCAAYISGDRNVCDADRGFQRFKQRYCNTIGLQN